MVIKIQKVNIFFKTIKIFLGVSIPAIFLMFKLNQFFQLEFIYIKSFFYSFPIFSLSVKIDSTTFFFLAIVTPVVIYVSFYRKLYMAHYNRKKFFALIILFFFSILTLVIRSSPLVFIIGWDGLGVTSICLIIFYPNKTSLYNSVLTIFFNRLGDVFLIASLCIYFSIIRRYSTYFFTKMEVLILLIICAFTKRAQFPLSRWLPAAISAPTPISAIVHSSTLVTAGVLVFIYIEEFITVRNIKFLPLLIGALTFLAGGFLANIETDIKKVVAFSTMRQIRMIIIFCFILRSYICLTHMLFHAFFKTILFACCGVIFLKNFRAQKKIAIPRRRKGGEILQFFKFFLRIFIITGLIFSSSFFRKDLALEVILSRNPEKSIFFLILGSRLTLLYCSHLIKNTFRWFCFGAAKEQFKFVKKISYLFCFFNAILPFFILKFCSKNYSPFVFLEEIWFIRFIFFCIIFFKLPKINIFIKLTRTILFAKKYFYSEIKNLILQNSSKTIFSSDLIIFKPNLIGFIAHKPIYYKKPLLVSIFTFLVSNIIIYFFSLRRTWNWSFQSIRINLKI